MNMIKKENSKLKLTKRLFYCFIGLFVASIILLLLSRALLIPNPQNYDSLQPELISIEQIHQVFHDSRSNRLYVCYGGGYMNVYSTDGEFLWAVSTPKDSRHRFYISNNKIYIEQLDSTQISTIYVYDYENGSFIEKFEAKDFTCNNDFEISHNCEYYKDSYQVYKKLPDGSSQVIVRRPWWCHIQTYMFVICFSSFILALAAVSANLYYDYKLNQKGQKIKDPNVKFALSYYKILTYINIACIMLNLTLSFFTDITMIFIVPIVLHIIVSNIIINIKCRNVEPTEYEEKSTSLAISIMILTSILAFFSEIAAILIYGRFH